MKKRQRRLRTKSFDINWIPQSAAWEFGIPGTKWDIQKEVGDGLRSSVVTAALCWIMRTFPEAPVVVQRDNDGRWETVRDHPLAALLEQPNPFYSGSVLWMATAMDFSFGDAYWLKVRNGMGKVIEYWWIPRALIEPKWPQDDPRVFISHYEYRPGGQTVILKPEDVVHFRFGMDPRNIRRGFSQLASVMREVYVDDQAANFTASILRNLGIISIIFSPKLQIAPKEYAEKLKEYVQTNFTGDKRGQAMAFNAPTEAQVLQYNLQGFDVGPIRDIAEERVSAALGIPAAVIGFGTGLQQTKVGATMRELIQLGWTGGIIPNQRVIASEMDRSVLPDFQANPALFRTHFDTTHVQAFAEAEGEKSTRIIQLVQANILKVSQGQRELGFPVDSSQDKYLRELEVASTAPVAPTPPKEEDDVRDAAA